VSYVYSCVHVTDSDLMMATSFRESIRGVRRQLIQAINVSDLLLVDLLDKAVITGDQYRQLMVRHITLIV